MLEQVTFHAHRTSFTIKLELNIYSPKVKNNWKGK
jgi:hypothetical protein